MKEHYLNTHMNRDRWIWDYIIWNSKTQWAPKLYKQCKKNRV